MIYIIDGNNVAGKLKMLGQDGFDRILADMVVAYNQGRGGHIYLVFDGTEPMGDKIAKENNVSVVYSPKDDYYESADDKIVEMLERFLNQSKDQVTVITEDTDLIARLKKTAERYNQNRLFLESSVAWAVKLSRAEDDKDDEENRGLSEDEQEDINDELLRAWKDNSV